MTNKTVLATDLEWQIGDHLLVSVWWEPWTDATLTDASVTNPNLTFTMASYHPNGAAWRAMVMQDDVNQTITIQLPEGTKDYQYQVDKVRTIHPEGQWWYPTRVVSQFNAKEQELQPVEGSSDE